MATKWRSSGKKQMRSVSAMLLDFVFGESQPQPEVAECSDEQAWQDWLNSMADREAVIEFEDTKPTSWDGLLEERLPTGMSKGTAARQSLK